MTLRERVENAIRNVPFHERADAAIGEVFKFAERLAVQGPDHDPAVGIRIAFIAALKRAVEEE